VKPRQFSSGQWFGENGYFDNVIVNLPLRKKTRQEGSERLRH
jgi:hypothetical protein